MYGEFQNPNDYWRYKQAENHEDVDPDEAMKSSCAVMIFYSVAFAMVILIFGLCSGCTTTKYVPVIEQRIDTVLQSNTIRDSVYLHDSTFVEVKGDTVKIVKWHTKYVLNEVHDTIYKSRVDSVPMPYHVTEYVEKDLSWWQKTRLIIMNLLLIATGVWLLWKYLLPLILKFVKP